MSFEGEKFLHQKNQELHTTDPVEHEQERRDLSGETTTQKPAEKLHDWMAVLERTHTSHRDDPQVMERIKDWYHKEYVIKPEDVPETYFDTQKRLAREQGHGDIEITPEMRNELTEVLIADQASTLDTWLNYLTSEDADVYPTWVKYWAFTQMVKLSSFDKEKHAFGKRDAGTVAPFPDLNREALAYVTDAIEKKAKGEQIPAAVDNPEFKELLNGANFGKLYAHAIEKVTPAEQNELLTTEGEWIKYDQGKDHMPLVESLQGFGTGWCTAGESTAATQLKAGDFYVFYSKNKDGKSTVPRVAIRMNGKDEIGEVRGIAPNQNMDPYITPVLDQKLKEFGHEGDRYQKKSADMRRLTEIWNQSFRTDKKTKETEYLNPTLTKEDLRFLYEIDTKIDGFGYQKDPRIEEITEHRDKRTDIATTIGCRPDQVSFTKEEALSGDIVFHYGELFLDSITSAEGLTLPQSIGGNLQLYNLTSAEGLTLPQNIGGHLFLESLASAKGLTLPQSIGGSLNLERLTSAEGLALPQSIGGHLDLRSLTSAEGLNLPQSIGGYLDLNSLTSAEGLNLPQSIGGDLYLRSLTSAEKNKIRAERPDLNIYI